MPSRRVTARLLRRGLLAIAGIGAAILGTTAETENAVANGDTRALTIYHTHTQESATITFKRDGRYDRAALEQLNWLLRDWRINEPTKMDPRLFDTVWEAYRQVGSSQPINIVSAYRSPGTNAMLRRRSKMVAEYSQHMLGKAMDFYLTDVPIDRIREVGFQMSRGGVGWYPHANTPFIHMDVGSVRSWPRMSRDQLARIFPDGKTVHLPPDGHPLPHYEEAKAEILARGGTVAGITTQLVSAEDEDSPGLMDFLAGLFRSTPAPQPAVAVAVAQPSASRRGRQAPVVAVASADPDMPIATKTPLAYAAASPETGGLPGNSDGQGVRSAQGMLTAEPGATAASETMPPVVAPLPPRRPSDALMLATAAVAMPLPPPRPVQLVSLDGGMAHLAPAPKAAPAPIPAVSIAPAPMPAAAPVARASLVKADADAKQQLQALFEAASTGAGTGRNAPVHVATARAIANAPDKAVSATPGPVTTRFTRNVPESALLGDRFSGSAASILRSSQ